MFKSFAVLLLLKGTIGFPSPSQDHIGSALPLAKRDASQSTVPLENNPWYLSDIVIVEASPDVHPQIIQSSISFNIRDTNLQLEFNSSCTYMAPNGTTGPPVTTEVGYVQCQNPNVGFEYQWQQYDEEWIGTIGIVRGYVYNDTSDAGELVGVSVFGWWNVTPEVQIVDGGIEKTQACMEIHVTAESE